MAEPQRAGVQHLAFGRDGRRRKVPGPVYRVADDRVAERGEVDADLVRAPRLERQRHGGRPAEPLEDAVVRDGADALFSRPRGSPPAVAAVADNLEADRPGVIRDAAFDERDVLSLDIVPAEELLEAAQDLARAREDDGARRLLVEAVDHADVGALPVSELEIGVDAREQGVLLARLRGEGEQSGGLVGDDEIVVLVQNHEPRAYRSDRRTVDVEGDARLLSDGAPRLATRDSVDVDSSRFDVLLGLASGKGMRAGNPKVETHAGIV